MINPPAPPEIPKPTLEEFNDFLARKALQEEQVNIYRLILPMSSFIGVFAPTL